MKGNGETACGRRQRRNPGFTKEALGEQARWSRSDRLSGGFRGCQGVGKDRKADKQVLANTLGVLPKQEQY